MTLFVLQGYGAFCRLFDKQYPSKVQYQKQVIFTTKVPFGIKFVLLYLKIYERKVVLDFIVSTFLKDQINNERFSLLSLPFVNYGADINLFNGFFLQI